MSVAEIWRYRCPDGHASWHSRPGDQTPGNYYCECCDEYFQTLYDQKHEKPKPDRIE